MRCGECGSQNISIKNVKGKSFYGFSRKRKVAKYVKILVDLHLLECEDCQNNMLKAGDGKYLDEAIEKSLDILEG